MHTPDAKKFQVLQGKNQDNLALLQARLTLADPTVTYNAITQEFFDALLEDEIDEMREQIASQSKEFAVFDRELIDEIGDRVVRQILAKLSNNSQWSDADEDTAHAHLLALLDEYIKNHQ